MVVLPSFTVTVGLRALPVYTYVVGDSVTVGLTAFAVIVLVIALHADVPPLWFESGTAFHHLSYLLAFVPVDIVVLLLVPALDVA
jgi:hypothetical protein